MLNQSFSSERLSEGQGEHSLSQKGRSFSNTINDTIHADFKQKISEDTSFETFQTFAINDQKILTFLGWNSYVIRNSFCLLKCSWALPNAL